MERIVVILRFECGNWHSEKGVQKAMRSHCHSNASGEI